MILPCVSVLDPPSQISITALGFTISAPVKQTKKITWTISFSNKALMTFHHNTQNSHVPGINFFAFFVYAVSISSHPR